MRRRPRSGFSLVELLVVIGMIGILAGFILPVVQQVRATADRLGCLNNLKQIGLALHHFHDARGRFPPVPFPSPPDGNPNAYLSWMALILPQLEQDSLYQVSVQACRIDPDALHDPPHLGLATVVRTYVCPADSRLLTPQTDRFQVRAAFTSYIGNAGTVSLEGKQGFAGVFGDSPNLSQFTDGTSQTLMAGERPPPDSFQAGWWYPGWWYLWGSRGPNAIIVLGGINNQDEDRCPITKVFGPGRTDNPCDRNHLWSLHPGGANFLFVDGSARFLPYSAEALIIPLASRNGGEIVELP